MVPDTETADRSSMHDEPICAAIDETGRRPQLVVANIDRDDVWLTMDAGAAPVLADWR